MQKMQNYVQRNGLKIIKRLTWLMMPVIATHCLVSLLQPKVSVLKMHCRQGMKKSLEWADDSNSPIYISYRIFGGVLGVEGRWTDSASGARTIEPTLAVSTVTEAKIIRTAQTSRRRGARWVVPLNRHVADLQIKANKGFRPPRTQTP